MQQNATKCGAKLLECILCTIKKEIATNIWSMCKGYFQLSKCDAHTHSHCTYDEKHIHMDHYRLSQSAAGTSKWHTNRANSTEFNVCVCSMRVQIPDMVRSDEFRTNTRAFTSCNQWDHNMPMMMMMIWVAPVRMHSMQSFHVRRDCIIVMWFSIHQYESHHFKSFTPFWGHHIHFAP